MNEHNWIPTSMNHIPSKLWNFSTSGRGWLKSRRVNFLKEQASCALENSPSSASMHHLAHPQGSWMSTTGFQQLWTTLFQSCGVFRVQEEVHWSPSGSIFSKTKHLVLWKNLHLVHQCTTQNTLWTHEWAKLDSNNYEPHHFKVVVSFEFRKKLIEVNLVQFSQRIGNWHFGKFSI